MQTRSTNIQHKICNDSFQVLEDSLKGRGLFTTHNIAKNTMVLQYKGEVITAEEGYAREQEYGDAEACYMFWFSYLCAKSGKQIKKCIDATLVNSKDAPARLINHSRKRPNLQPVVINDQLWLKARKDILAGEELLYDYGEQRPDVVAAFPWLRN